MTPRPIPSQDLDRLSAYLDGQLTPDETVRLEARLAQEPALKQALGELRATTQLLQNLPQLKAPRNFTLTAAHAAKRPHAQPTFSFLRLATAFSAIVLVFAFVGEFFTAQPASLAPQSDTASGTTWAETEASPPGDEAFSPTPEEANDTYDGNQGGGAAPTDMETGDETVTPEVGIAALLSETLTPTPAEKSFAPTPLPLPPVATEAPNVRTTTAPPVVDTYLVNGWRITQVLLVLVTLGLGLAAWRWRR